MSNDKPDEHDDTPDDTRRAGYLWEWAEDRCHVCGILIRHALRWMHQGVCDACAQATKH